MTDRELLELLVEKVSSMDEKITNMDERITGMDSRITAMDDRISAMDDRISSIEYKQNIIMEQTAFLSEYKTESNEKIVSLEKKVQQNTTDITLLKKLIAQ